MARFEHPPKPTDPPTDGDRGVLIRRDFTVAPVSRWSYLGCYEDSNDRILTAFSNQDIARNLPRYCCDLCSRAEPDYSFCGVEVGDECYCDSTTSSSLTELSASACDSKCAGESGAACGGHWAMGLYSLTDPKEDITTSAPSTTVEDVSGYSYLGCYTDSEDRILNGASGRLAALDPQFCCDYCLHQGAGYPVCGVEDGDNCYCDSAIAEGALRASAEDCNEPCSGANSLQCGGAWRIHIYSATGVGEPGVTTTTTTATTTTSAAQFSSYSQPDSSPGLSGGAIGGIVVGAVLFLVLAGLFFFRRRVEAFFSKGGNKNGINSASEVYGSPATQNKPEEQYLQGNYHQYHPHGSHQPSELDGAQQHPVELGDTVVNR